jgi:hypothetical protein
VGLPGGAADKAGNRYEDWWTALRVAELLRGRAARIRLEPRGRRAPESSSSSRRTTASGASR